MGGRTSAPKQIRGANERALLDAIAEANGSPARTMPPPKPHFRRFRHFPLENPARVDSIDFDKVLRTLRSKNSSLPPEKQLQDADWTELERLVETLRETTSYHVSTATDGQVSTLAKLLHWPASHAAVAFDLVRYSLLHPDTATKLARICGDDLFHTVMDAMLHADASAGLVVIAIRILVNGFCQVATRDLLMERDLQSRILRHAVGCALRQDKPAAALAMTAVLCNFSHVYFRLVWPGPEQRELSDSREEEAANLFNTIVEVLQQLKDAKDSSSTSSAGAGGPVEPSAQAIQNCLVAIGTLLCTGDSLVAVAQTHMELQTLLESLRASTAASESDSVRPTIEDCRAILKGDAGTVVVPEG